MASSFGLKRNILVKWKEWRGEEKQRSDLSNWQVEKYGAGRQAEQEVCHFICPSTELHFFTSPLIWDCCKFWSSFGCNFTVKTLPPDRFGLIICG